MLEVDECMCPTLLEFARRRWGIEKIKEADRGFGEGGEGPLDAPAIFVPWLLFHRPFDRHSIADWYARESRGPVGVRERAWLDSALPALKGLTPREAVATASPRRKADLLLKEIESVVRTPDAHSEDSRWRPDLAAPSERSHEGPAHPRGGRLQGIRGEPGSE
ncbi:MAG: hypothetical protein HZB25_06000 [Candidatus Eisenbacteria bacterium]|nr:hypothetical protein [Candidatus Eisenbacteria bacterium]